MSRKTRLLVAIIIMLISFQIGKSQFTNDDCDFAKFIPNVDEYCSMPHEFSNDGATKSSQARPSCWPQDTEDSDVWFAFVPKNLGVFIQVTGNTVEKVGTLVKPSVALYRGNCNGLTEIACGSVLFDENIVELTQADLNIGSTYYLRVDARDQNIGDFRLCINTFAPVKSPEADCRKAVVLCDKEEIFVENLSGTGEDNNEIEQSSCLNGIGGAKENASVWYKWTCKDAGNLTFVITPNSKFDDIDFGLYELPGGLDDCANKKSIRCMAAGETIGGSANLNSPCFGDTGLNTSSKDLEESPGCGGGHDNFVKDIVMVPGKSYVLIINNFSESGFGFSIKWGGTGTFLGPEADFEIKSLDRFECDKTVTFSNLSSSATDSIISYNWSFGDDSNPFQSSAFGPIDVLYSSFGTKTAALTVESKRGCTVTKIKDFFINSCCKDTTTLSVSGLVTNLLCSDLSNGVIDAFGKAGSPQYSYSLDSVNYQPIPRFTDLGIGSYTLYIRDKKGCQNKTILHITAPPDVLADAGEEITVELGESAFLNGSAIGGTGVLTPLWSPTDSIADINAFETKILPLITKAYTLLVTDENGCTDTDLVNVKVIKNVKIFWPNIIKAKDGVPNGIFKLFGNKSIRKVRLLEVYDRWGNLVYKGNDLDINNPEEGWDGTLNSRRLVNGVYTWAAILDILDNTTEIRTGDVTVID